MKWRGPDKLTFSNRAERAAYIEAHPVPDEWEQKPRRVFEIEHSYDEGHPKITREHEGRPLRWCVACHVPLFHGWYCGSITIKRGFCRAFVYKEGTLCGLHRKPENQESPHVRRQRNQERAYNKRRLKEGKPPLQRPFYSRQKRTPNSEITLPDEQYVTSTSRVHQDNEAS